MDNIQIILTDWAGYPFNRVKHLGDNKVKCGIGRILKNMARFDPGLNFDCTLIINDIESQADRSMFFKKNAKTYLKLKDKFNFLSNVFFRSNKGFDIGAYNFGLKKLYDWSFDGDVVFMNSSVVGPNYDGWLMKYKSLFEKNHNTGLCGISINSVCPDPFTKNMIFSPHVQSFFLYSSMKILSNVFPVGFDGADIVDNKILLIKNGEVGISKKVLDAGYGICCSIFPDFFYRLGDEWTIETGDIRYKKKYAQYANSL